MKTFHEAPIAYFEKVQKLTDGDYALVHLFETCPEYLEMFKKAVQSGREVILDNSLFELRTKFDPARFAYWVRELQPTYYIVPDVWKESQATIDSFFSFINNEGEGLPGKRIGVAQGYSVEDTAKCYKAIAPYCDRIAINFDYSIFADRVLKDGRYSGIPTCQKMSYGRAHVLDELYRTGVIDTTKEHHLLGCGTPQEMKIYRKLGWDWITSVDTCSPVMFGICNQAYPDSGVEYKLDSKMCDLIHHPYIESQMELVEHNIKKFKEWCG